MADKSDFYSLFLKLARHSPALPLTAEARRQASDVLLEIASTVDAVIGETIDPNFVDQDIQTYVKNVERAASDLGSRKARERVLDNKLAAVFPKDI